MGVDMQRQMDDLLEELGFGYWKASEYQSLEPGWWDLFISRCDGHYVRITTRGPRVAFWVDDEVFSTEKLKGPFCGWEEPYKGALTRGLRKLDEHFGVRRSRLDLLMGG